MKQSIIINNFNLGGIADSEYQGIEGSVADMSWINIHSRPWIISVNQSLKKEYDTGGELVIAIVPCSDGKIYFFGESGKIWRKDGANYSLWKNVGKRVYDAKEFEWYVYYSTKTHLGRWKIGSETLENNFGEFNEKDDHYHPMYVLNMILYVGDGKLVAQMEDTNWTPDALDLRDGMKIKCFGGAWTDLIIGTTVHNNADKTEIFRWNTWSESWTISDDIPEQGINAVLSIDNAILVQTWNKWNIYAYNGQNLERHKRIPWYWNKGSAEVLLNASVNAGGIPLFGLTKTQGEAVETAVYSYGNYASNYPVVLNKEWKVDGAKIGVITIIGWIPYITTEQWIYTENTEEKLSKGIIITRVIDISRENNKNGNITVHWKEKPEWTDIKIYLSVKHEDWREVEIVHDKNRNTSYTKTNIDLWSYFQIKMEMIATGNISPEVTAIEIKIQS